MELSSPDPEATVVSTRRSGRVSQKPKILSPSSATGSKRKRGDADTDIDMEDAGEEDEEEESSEESEGEPDPEELKERKKKARIQKKAAPKKPAAAKPPAKKAKQTNGGTVSLAIRPAKPKVPRKKPQHQAADAEAVGGLYAEVFGKGQSLDDAAAAWLAKFNNIESEAMADLFNFTLKCAGCDHKINAADVEDPDEFTNKITDIQEAFGAVTDYPLISKSKGSNAFRDSYTGIFASLMATMAKTGQLFSNEAFNEVLNAWLSTMASSGNRPLRHTATTASLSVISALCRIGHDSLEASSKTLRQAEGEKKKTRVNKERVAELEKKVSAAQEQKEAIDEIITAWFDTVFVHRYRDVDPKIRDEAIRALGEWIILYPDHFFEGQFLRYMGWVLSDTNKDTRHEVLRALMRLYKLPEKLSGLRTFTERFRSRIIEMAARDSDPAVRADAVQLVDLLREAGFLEPDDLDTIGRLIFDTEPKVRKSVVGFFTENINELYRSKIEDLGGEEALEEALPNVDTEDDFDTPKLVWIKLKCLAETLRVYDAVDEIEPDDVQVLHRAGAPDSYILVPQRLESRFSLAAEALYDKLPEIHEWEVLSGYLLYDHSQTPDEELNGASSDVAFKQAFKIDEREEVLLLEVLNSSVKLKLKSTIDSNSDKKKKLTKAQKAEADELQETAARHLAQLIPRLLNKFGAIPEAASAVLRLQHILNLEIFQELRQDLTAYSALLDDIKKQFSSHGKPEVLQEASVALLHAKSYEDLEEVTEGKLNELWDDTINTFHALSKGRDLSTRGNLAEEILTGLENSVLRIANLSSISDSREYLDTAPVITQKTKSKSKQSASQAGADSAILSLISIISRGIPNPDLPDEDTDVQENNLVLQATVAVNSYFMWQILSMKKLVEASGRVPYTTLSDVAEKRDAYVRALTEVLPTRKAADELRLALAGFLIDLYCMFGGLVTLRPKAGTKNPPANTQGDGDDEDPETYKTLAMEIPREAQLLLLQILGATEKQFAKRTKKKLEEEIEDDPVTDEEPEESDNDDEAEEGDEQKLAHTLLAERRLCEFTGKLIMGVWGGWLDGEVEGAFQAEDDAEESDADDEGKPKRKKSKKGKEKKVGAVEWRIKRNARHLGPNFKALIDSFEANRPGAPKKTRTKARSKTARASVAKNADAGAVAAETSASAKEKAGKFKSAAVVIEDDDEDEDMSDEIEDPDEDEARAAREVEEAEAEARREGDEAVSIAEEVESIMGD
ncbi:STAG-domain-containing protein [Venturia nashicola]|uniref:STAG-domain-containing protein n=1 Tax=Venturia nashicola TaxID=86259 RepID=A0A4Z1NYH5_9PEZI|nr:STAG-domain-containing protein [Venturia nashicola]